MSKIEAVYHGIKRPDTTRQRRDITDENVRFDRLLNVIAVEVAQAMGEKPADYHHVIKNMTGREAMVHLHMNIARGAVHPLFDTLTEAAETSESAHVSFEPAGLTESCLASNHTNDFMEDTGLGIESLPFVLLTTAQVLGRTAFQFELERKADTPPDYKSFTISSNPN